MDESSSVPIKPNTKKLSSTTLTRIKNWFKAGFIFKKPCIRKLRF
jgi:hypothetical protein